jgi:iron complex transport system substrate-binding protein
MKLVKLISMLLALAFIFALAACAPKTEEPAVSDSSDIVTDMMGREVKLDAPAEKIVVLTAADCEILYAIGAGTTVVGRGEYCDYPEEVLSIPAVSSGDDTNTEQIIKLEPDIVIMSEMAQTEEQISALENAGVRVLVTNADNIDGTYQAIQLIGTVVGRENEAKALIDNMSQAFYEISQNAADRGSKTIYFEISPLEHGLWAAGRGTFMAELADMLGLVNVFNDFNGWGEVSQEHVIARNPDFIVTTTMSYDSSTDPVQEILGRAGWQDITAVKNGAVMQSANHDEMTRPGPRLVDAAKALYTFVYENETAAPAEEPSPAPSTEIPAE